ncbi:hypothetical protein JIN85_02415 [Luteolibacter pohnpeiensis]|uniref:Cytochrome c domain-containing protein n=1 Tax=Luteolibacter pohnpeiensis TaxID=454153 RepID=A0A934S4Z5_9BACT|nr:cytochrome c peroxidase [Luteolibacter pohnpeiensis]MBK1881249.1 hypothetical protein [Luteolibacter pohnpeiensis]
MKVKPIIPLLAALVASAFSQDGVLDLTAPANYANQPIPDYITKDNTPADNSITDLGATLGRVMFYDKRLSANNAVSCSSCHQQEHAFGDPSVASVGVAGTTGRHSMRLINARFSDESRFFWDERADSAEDQATQPIQDHKEMGFSGTEGDGDFSDLIEKLSGYEEYQVLFQGVYGDPQITEERVGKSLAQFVRSIQSFDSRYDEGRSQVANDGQPFPNFTANENAGKQIFLNPPNLGGAGCAGCHQPPEFSIDPASGNNGIVSSFSGVSDFTNTRAPSLRNLVDRNGSPHGGFMHDASLTTILAVINHYDSIPENVTGLDTRLLRAGGATQQLGLTEQQKANLASFLETLTGNAVYTDERYATPFAEDGSLELLVLPNHGTTMDFSTVDDQMMVTIHSPAVPNVSYLFQTSSDLEHWESTRVTASADGWLDVMTPTVQSGTSQFYRFAYQAEE